MDVGSYLAATELEEQRPKQALRAYRKLRRAQMRFDGRLLVAAPIAAAAAAGLGLLLARIFPSVGRYVLCACLVLVGLGAVSAFDSRWYRATLRSKSRFRGMAGGLGQRKITPLELLLGWLTGLLLPLVHLLSAGLIVLGGALVSAVITLPAVIAIMITQHVGYISALDSIPQAVREGVWYATATVVGAFFLLDLPPRPGPIVVRQLRELPMAVALSWVRLLAFVTGTTLCVGIFQVWRGAWGEASVALAIVALVAYAVVIGLTRAWSEKDNIFVTLCRLGEGRCLLATGRWGSASRILWRRAQDPTEQVPKTLEHGCWGTLQCAYAASVPKRRREYHLKEARDRLTAAKVALGEAEETAYRNLFADALAKLQALVRAMESKLGGSGSR